MLKKIIVFLIVFCLLSFTGVFSLAEKNISSGKYWSNHTLQTKISYLVGFIDRLDKCLEKINSLILIHSDDKTALLELFTLGYFLRDHMDSIINVMDDLYKDPTNTYIPFRYIC